MIVYSALAQSLIQAASAPVGNVTPEFADLVLLANPAIEGARFLPIYDLATGAGFKTGTMKQLPVFICAQADNDQPVGIAFPLGNAGHAIDEATIGDLEKECVTHALGFVPSFRTHALAGPMGNQPFVLDPPGIVQANPFWVVGAVKEVIDGHGGIWQTPFLQFIASSSSSTCRLRGTRRRARYPWRQGLGERPRDVREIHRADRASAALIRTIKVRCGSSTAIRAFRAPTAVSG